MAQHMVQTVGGAILMASAPVNGRQRGFVVLERGTGNALAVLAPDEAFALASALLEAAAEAREAAE